MGKLDKSINIKTKIERLSDEEDRLNKTDFFAGVLYDYIGGLPPDQLKEMTKNIIKKWIWHED